MSSELQSYLAILSGVIAVVSAVPYIRDTWRQKTRPNVVTWLTWTSLNGINAVVAFSDGAVQTGIFSVFATLTTGTILLFGLRNGLKTYTSFDVVCQLVVLAGIPLWLLTDQPAIAVGFVLLVDIAGGLPTLRHAWRAPHEETLTTFAISALAFIPLVLSMSNFTFVALAMPLYIFLYNLVIITIIAHRRRLPLTYR